MNKTSELTSLIDLLRNRARELRGAIAYTFLLDHDAGRAEFTFAELDARARDIAARLQEHGAVGERVLLLYPPGIDYIAGFFGCLYAGAIAVPVFPPRPDRPLGRFLGILEDAQPKFALGTELVCGVAEPMLGHHPMRWLATDALDGTRRDLWRPPATDGDALAFLQYTSGSTASPKGVMVSHRNLLHNQALIQRAFGTSGSSRVVGWLPLYHDMGLIGNVLHPMFLGTTCMLMSPLEFLRNPLRWLQAIEEFGGTVSGGPNFAYDLCVRKIPAAERAKLDLSRWTVAFNGAEPIRAETVETFCDAFRVSGFRREAFVPCYGLAEATLLVTGGKPARIARWFRSADLEQRQAVEASPDDHGTRALVSCGRAQSLRIVEPESRRVLGEGQVGEIWVSGQSVAGGYWRKSALTAETFDAKTLADDAPYLRTGDLGFVRDGDLFVTGRIKDLLILRGRNHYPQDLELTAEKSHSALRPGCGAAFSVEVDGEERLVLVQEVISEEGISAGEIIDTLRQAIAIEHEVRAHTVVLIAPRTIPKTSSGKIQRGACREAFLGGRLAVVHTSTTSPRSSISLADMSGPPSAPVSRRTDDARWMGSRVARLLGVPPSAIDLELPVSRFALDSLQVVELTHDIERTLGARLPVEAFFAGNSLRDLARRLREVPEPEPTPALRSPSADAPLSDGQRALWLLQQLDPDSPVYTVPNALRVTGPLDVAALKWALEALALRHPILRTLFPIVAGEPVQRVLDSFELPFVVEEASGDPRAFEQKVTQVAYRSFRLDAELPIRVNVFVVGAEEHVLLIALHHIVTDFWSQALLLGDLGALYQAARKGLAASLGPADGEFRDYVTWQSEVQRGPSGERQARFWLDQLRAPLSVLELPLSRPRPPVQSFKGAAKPFVVGKELTAALKRLAAEQGATPFMVLLAAFQTLLHRYTGQEDLVVGTVTAGRTRAAFAGTAGYFVNPLALRSRPTAAQPFDALLAQTRETVLGAFEHQDYPFSKLVQRLRPTRDTSRSPVFQAMFVHQKGSGPDGERLTGFAMNVAETRLAWADLTLAAVPLEQRIAQFDLTLTMGEVEGQLHASLDYCTELFEPPFIHTMAEHLQNLLAAIVRAPQTPLAQLPMLSESDHRTQIELWNDTRRAYPLDDTVHEWIARRSRETPDAVALLSGGVPLSFAQLERRAKQLAHRLVREGVGPESVVGLCLDRRSDLVVAMLAVLAAGGAFLPMDPQIPHERMAHMLGESRAGILVTEQALAPHGTAVRAVLLDVARSQLDLEPTSPIPRTVHPGQVACVIYTSGSTGVPKGTMVEHRSLVNLVASFLDCYRPTPNDRILPVTSTASISFVGEVLPLLCAGGAVVIPSREEMLDEARLQALIVAGGVTILSTLPSRITSLRDAARSLANVRLLLSGGESLSVADLPHLASTLELVNGYGLTETTACSSFHTVRRAELVGGRAVPIGRPVRNTRLHVLDQDMQCVPVGCAGELYVGGDGLARGYHRRPEVTAARFVPDPFCSGERLYRTGDRVRWRSDGNLEYLGRLDNQVKIRGHRIELEEIEAALRRHPAVGDAVVVARGSEHMERRLVGYFVPSASRDVPAVGSLLAFLRERLPEPWVPATLVSLKAFPLSPHGKVDRDALPEPDLQRPELSAPFLAPLGELEGIVASVWKAALRLEQVGVNDNFFDLGGHSLLLAKVHAQLQEALRRDLTLVDLFRFPTIGTLAAHLGRRSGGAPRQAAALRAAALHEDSIAIVGLAGRFPGASGPDKLWTNLTNGVESISFFSAEELIAAGADPALVNDPSYVKANGMLGDIDTFDAEFFGVSPREAELMDPQHRLFLECAFEAVERAGYDAARYAGRIGVFAGSSMNTYMLMNLVSHMKLVASLDTLQASLGNDKDPMTARVSYKLDLKGPSVTIQSASSTSLVAVHVACKALLVGDCEMALAGGVSIHLPKKSGYMYQEGGTTAKDGHCRAFDADATGFVSGQGAGVVLLKRLADAVADGDHIHAVIRGSACNNDGSLKVSFMAPSVEGQVDVYRQALASARVKPEEIGYIECHGTGTTMGDPIEIAALTQAYGGPGVAPGSCAIGSLKTNIGHLDTAAGVCGLIKATLCVEHGKLVPTLHFKKPNPQIEFDKTPFAVNTSLRDWDKAPRVAGVTSLGMGGTNAHVILSEAPARSPSGPSRRHQLLLLSARSEAALEAVGEDLATHLEGHPEVSLADAAYVLQTGRRRHKLRRAIVCEGREEAIAALRSPGTPGVRGVVDGGTRTIAFLFPGQGSQYVDMARGLYDTEPEFRAEVDRASELLVSELGLDLRERLQLGEGADPDQAARALAQTAVTQPALFVVEYALARLLMSWGIRPSALLGHSLGEYVAACLAGVFSLADALTLVAARGRLMQQMPSGSMLAVGMSAGDTLPLLEEGLCIAAVNEPGSCVVSGPKETIRALQDRLSATGITGRLLQTSHAFHSSMLDGAVAPFAALVREVKLRAPTIPFLSNVTGTWITDAQATDPRYWASQLRQPVLFASAVAELLRDPSRICVEVGPSVTLAGFVRSHPSRTPTHEVVTTLRHPKETEDDARTLLRAVGRLWSAGVAIDDHAFFAAEERRRVPLPTYPFERKRYWVDPKPALTAGDPSTHDVRRPQDDWYSTPVWRQVPPVRGVELPRTRARVWVLADASDLCAEVVLGLRRSGHEVIVLRAGRGFARIGADEAEIDPVSASDYESAFDVLPTPTLVVHLWSAGRVGSPNTAQELGFFAPMALMQAWGRRSQEAPLELAFVSRDLHDVTGAEPLEPLQATLLGPCRVIPLEYPAVRCRSVDLSCTDAPDAHDSEQLVAELLDGTLDEVALRGGRRWALSYEKVTLPSASAGLARLREGGVYLVTGGLGGVGLALAAQLASTVRAKLVLVGRSGLPPRDTWTSCAEGGDRIAEQVRRVLALESEHGAEVEVVAADVGREGELRVALDRARERFGALHGVIHAAGVPGGGLLQLRDRSAAEEVFAGKLRGALELDAVLVGEPVDFVALCSSLTAVVSMPGQADYVAANAVLDALARARAKEGLPWLSIGWDAWREVGMAASLDAPSEVGKWRSDMLRDGLSNEEGVTCFARALASGLGHVLVSTHPIDARLRAPRAIGARDGKVEPKPPIVSGRDTRGSTSEDDLEGRISAVWREMLGIDKIGLHDNFFDLGGNSLIGLKIIGRLRSDLGVTLSEIGLFQAPTIGALTTLIRGTKEPSEAADEAQSRGERRREKRMRRER